MSKFEYKTVPMSRQTGFWEGIQIDIPQLENVLAQMGSEGWELVTSIEKSGTQMNPYFCLIFKRQIQGS